MSRNETYGAAICPECGSNHVRVDVFQEQTGSETNTKWKSKYRERTHGCLWWLLIGWWWWIVDLILWVLFPFFKLLWRSGRKRHYTEKGKEKSTTQNYISYRKMFVCQSCGHLWEE